MSDCVFTINEIKDKLEPVFKKYGLLRASLFGSYARDEASVYSDVDLLVQMDETFDLSKYLKFEISVRKILKKKVDLVEYRCINEFMQDDILKEAIPIYEHKRQESA